MQLAALHIAALLAGAVAVITVEKTRWIQSVAIVELIVALFLVLMTWDFLRLPIANVEGVLLFVALAGWVPVVIFAKAKATLVPAAMMAWIAGVSVLIELGWIRLDAIGALL